MDAPTKLRQDAQRNLEKLKQAASEAFQEQGLNVPLELIAQRAGVSTGTLYNRFGSREALIDAVLPDLAQAHFATIFREVEAHTDPWEKLVCYIQQVSELQWANRALNDAIAQIYPQAIHLVAACGKTMAYGDALIASARAHGVLRANFSAEDLFFIFWTNGLLIRSNEPSAKAHWERHLALVLDGMRTTQP